MDYFDILTALTSAGIDVALPGAREGVCTAPYAVVQEMGTYRSAHSIGVGYTLFSVHCYAPISAYGELDSLTDRVRRAMKSLEPDVRPAGSEGAHIVNDRFRAHEGFAQYIVLRSLRAED